MSDDAFAAPGSDSDPLDDVVQAQARKTLYRDGAGALGLALFSLCCNPCFIFTFLSIGASMQVFSQIRWMKISLEEDFPEDAGGAAQLMAGFAIVVALGGVLLRILGSAIQVGTALQ